MKERKKILFLPDSLEFKQSGFLRGRRKLIDNTEVYYVTNCTPTKTPYQSIGFIGQKVDYSLLHNNIPLFININNEQITIKHNKNQPITQIVYEYKRFKNSDILYKESNKYGKHLEYLSTDLRKCTCTENGRNFITKYLFFVIFILDGILNAFTKLRHLIEKSSTFVQFEENIRSIRWFLKTVLEEKKVTPKLGNLIIAKTVDLTLGMFLTTYVLDYEEQIFEFMNYNIENIISNLRGLLLYLMGQPIGLKLNYGFNNFLGQFFLYHISLWRVFLHGLYPMFVRNFKYFVWPGILGFSYQIAMISDIVSIATFHSYCIYIYAARLFNLQLRCLISLWRVLIGRKYNPLRKRVDSCQYSHNQLFIGTLSFTILLFLLPTTTMYYVVFSVFRLITLTIDGSLLMMRKFMYTVPLYSVFLWTLDSSSVAGNVHIVWKSFDDKGNVKIEAKLERPPLVTTIKKFVPDSVSIVSNQRTFGDIFHSSVTGTIL